MSTQVDRLPAPAAVRSSTPTLIERTVTTATTMEFPVGAFRWVDAEGAEVFDLVDAPKVGVPVSLRDEFDHELAHTTTDEFGRYQFDNLPAGAYSVVFTVPSGVTAIPAQRQSEQARLAAAMVPREHMAAPPVQTWTGANRTRSDRIDRPAARLRLSGSLG